MLRDLNESLMFVRVVEQGSFTAAARVLGTPKTTVSRKVQELEDRLGTKLLKRTTRRLGLTEAGQVYFDHCQRIARELEEAESAVTQLSGSPRGWLRITMPHGLGNALAPLLPAFLSRYPDVRVEFVLSNEVVDIVQSNVDLALRIGALPDSTLVARRLAQFSAHVYASPEYLARHGEPLVPADIAHHRALALRQHRRNDRYLWSLSDGQVEEERSVSPVVVANDPTVLRTAAVNGLGLALLGDAMMQPWVANGRVRRVLSGWRGPAAELNAVFPRGQVLPPKVRAFVDFVVAHWSIEASLAAQAFQGMGATQPPT